MLGGAAATAHATAAAAATIPSCSCQMARPCDDALYLLACLPVPLRERA